MNGTRKVAIASRVRDSVVVVQLIENFCNFTIARCCHVSFEIIRHLLRCLPNRLKRWEACTGEGWKRKKLYASKCIACVPKSFLQAQYGIVEVRTSGIKGGGSWGGLGPPSLLVWLV